MPGARDAVNYLPIILTLKSQTKKPAENRALYYSSPIRLIMSELS